jgi:hypothetical protein
MMRMQRWATVTSLPMGPGEAQNFPIFSTKIDSEDLIKNDGRINKVSHQRY